MRSLLHSTIIMPLFAILGGCAAGGGQPNEQLAGVLADFDTDTEYADSRRCLSPLQYNRVEVLDERHLLFSGRNDVWLNTLRSRCPGLRRHDTLLFERRGNRLCSLDRAEVMRRFLFWERTGPVCSLGEFHQLTEGQAELIREATRS